MVDWQQVVRERLSRLELDAAAREEICTELAAHLEDDYNDSIAAGASEEVATAQALLRVANWQRLRSQIESVRKKELTMNKRVSQFWFPAFLTLFLSQVALMLIQVFGPRVYISPAASHPRLLPPNAVFVTWLAILPLVGGLGAYLCNRAGGRAKLMFSAITFPVFPFLAFIVLGLPITMLFDDHVARNLTLPLFLIGFSAWVVFPAMALVAGGWFLRHFVQRSNGRRVTGD